MSDRMLVSLFVTVLAIIGMFFLFDLCIDDESEPGDLGMAAWMYRSEPPPGEGPGRQGEQEDDTECRNQCGNQHRDCENNTGECSDDDQLVVAPTICVEPGSCVWEGQ